MLCSTCQGIYFGLWGLAQSSFAFGCFRLKCGLSAGFGGLWAAATSTFFESFWGRTNTFRFGVHRVRGGTELFYLGAASSGDR